MKRTIFLLLIPVLAFAQNSRLVWWAHDAGFGSPSGSRSVLRLIVGEPFVGPMAGGNTNISGGFFGDTLFRPIIASAGKNEPEVPSRYDLFQNFPNPFNPSTVIRFALPSADHVRLVVYDLLGREVAVLVNEQRPAGEFEVRFDATNLASGVYLYRLVVGKFVEARKMILMK